MDASYRRRKLFDDDDEAEENQEGNLGLQLFISFM
jgi:hypothetical protein